MKTEFNREALIEQLLNESWVYVGIGIDGYPLLAKVVGEGFQDIAQGYGYEIGGRYGTSAELDLFQKNIINRIFDVESSGSISEEALATVIQDMHNTSYAFTSDEHPEKGNIYMKGHRLTDGKQKWRVYDDYGQVIFFRSLPEL